jgi:hypothetical protein
MTVSCVDQDVEVALLARAAEPKIRGFPMRKRCRTSRTRARFFSE